FGDGVAAEILNALAKIGDLRVPARTSCFAFRGLSLDARDIGRRLGVEALLEGSVRKAGQRLRITVQLIDSRNGYQLWSERFDRAVALDQNFAAAWAGLATAHVHLHGCDSEAHLEKAREASTRALRLDPQSAEAHVAAAQGLSMEQRYADAAAEFERALELDPTLF